MEGTVYFFTGLSGAGKTTIGGLFYRRLKEKKPDTILLDGDAVRRMVSSGTPFPFSTEAYRALQAAANIARDYTYEGRLKGAWMLFRLCKELAEQGHDVVCCSICMYRAVRAWNRENIPTTGKSISRLAGKPSTDGTRRVSTPPGRKMW